MGETLDMRPININGQTVYAARGAARREFRGLSPAQKMLATEHGVPAGNRTPQAYVYRAANGVGLIWLLLIVFVIGLLIGGPPGTSSRKENDGGQGGQASGRGMRDSSGSQGREGRRGNGMTRVSANDIRRRW